MRCRVGDLAVIVKSWAGNEGVPVKCLRLATEEELDRNLFEKDLGPVWVIDRPLCSSNGFRCALAIDAHLRPIRDPGYDAEDEMLHIARLHDQDKANALLHAMQKHRDRLVEEAPKQ